MRTGYRYGGHVKPVNTAGGLTMLKAKKSGEPSPYMAETHGALSKQRLDKRQRGGRISGEPEPGERKVSPREEEEANNMGLEHHVSEREKSEIHGAKHGGRKWIAGAIKHPGALTASAKKAGMSPMAFAQKHKHDSGTTGNRARLAVTLRGFHKK